MLRITKYNYTQKISNSDKVANITEEPNKKDIQLPEDYTKLTNSVSNIEKNVEQLLKRLETSNTHQAYQYKLVEDTVYYAFIIAIIYILFK